MEKIDKIMQNFISELGYKSADEMFARISSGKKLRSKLLLKIAPPSEQAYTLCAIIELIHLASLLHDDVIDDANLRRGKPSINALFGTKNAVMLGDILYSKGFFELSKFPPAIAQTISDAVCKLSIGELMDVELGEIFNTDEQKYRDMIYYKTAVLIEASAVCGAILAGIDEAGFRIYGRNLGLAFQIVDDILDIIQDAKTLGKPALSDLKEGKMTLPYIYLYRGLFGAEREKFRSLYKKDLGKDEAEWIRSKMIEHGALARAIAEAKELGNQACKAIAQYNNKELESIITAMIDREF